MREPCRPELSEKTRIRTWGGSRRVTTRPTHWPPDALLQIGYKRSMAIEIERKFLVSPDWPRPERGTRMVQGYLASSGGLTVRVRKTDDHAYLTLKGPARGLSRAEFEYEIPTDDADALLALGGGSVVEKTRYLVPAGPHTFEVDVFEGANQGLVVAEIELSSEDESFERPSWLRAEVSDDPRYRNSALVERPYSTWKEP